MLPAQPRWLPALALAALVHACPVDAAPAGITDRATDPAAARHDLPWGMLQQFARHGLDDRVAAANLRPFLRRLLGPRYPELVAALAGQQPLRTEGAALVGEGAVPGTLGYRAAFFAFGADGSLLAVLKGGQHGTTIERFGSTALLRDRAVLHAYQEFVGIDE